ncbi:unnamed protein product [Triticum turgidum subsp. durum]|uniref:Uncharacterized protein n=1 Tax=Triticum turgidum subsp. durum TaxID=4567 RepID=A0A9R1A340_TRITD|nr:unnamed protein product [Triticum turgidum subsp. durum]
MDKVTKSVELMHTVNSVTIKLGAIWHLQSIKASSRSKKANPESTIINARRLYRADDISSERYTTVKI